MIKNSFMSLATWLVVALFAAEALAGFSISDCSAGDERKLRDAIDEAKKMADNALNKLDDREDAVTKAAFKPLFQDDDVTTLKSLYTKVTKIETEPLQIMFSCNADTFIEWKDQFNFWTDKAFTYKATDANGNEVIKPVQAYGAVGRNKDKHPAGAGSFTINGYKKQLPIGDADCTNQAHIYISQKRINPPSNDGLDHRPLDTVNRDGFQDGTGFMSLDKLKPLSETVLHELMHAFGGLVREDSGSKKITDNPAAPVIMGKIREWATCAKLNAEARNIASPTARADPPMMLAKALFLQVKGKDTFWSTGAVKWDEGADHYAPDGVPEPSGNNKRGLVLRRWIA